MVSSLGAFPTSSTTSYPGTPKHTAGLEADLVRCQGELADWENCASAKTPEGKARIQMLRDKVSEVERQIARTAQAETKPVAASSPPSADKTTSVGNGGRIDVYA